MGSLPFAAAFVSGGSKAYVSNIGDNTISIIKETGSGAFDVGTFSSTNLNVPLMIAMRPVPLPPPPPPSAPIILPPSNFIGAVIINRFATQSDHINHLTWNASPSPETAGYHLYRNNQLIDTIPSTDSLMYDDHHRTQLQTIYLLSAFDANGVESTLLTLTIP